MRKTSAAHTKPSYKREPAQSTDAAIDETLMLVLGIGAVVLFGGMFVLYGLKALVVAVPF